MSVLKTLREKVAPELNHLYTVPPAEAAGGLDCGWRGHEHALHAYFIARMFGAEAELCRGDFALISRFMPAIASLGRDVDHAWCSVNGVAPVDLSMTLQYFGQVPQLRAPIVGEGPNGDWRVVYAEDESVLDDNIEAGNEILFIEKKVHTETAAALLDNPYLFLPPPPADDAKSWHALHGPGIYARITLHCFACANGHAKSVRSKLNSADAVAWIAGNYLAAETAIRAKLAAHPAAAAGEPRDP